MRYRSSQLACAIIFGVLTGCGTSVVDQPVEQPSVDPADIQLQWMMEHTDDYLNDHEFRREQLEGSLWRPDLPYASKRLNAYALDGQGWDLLPTFDVTVKSVGATPTTTTLSSEIPTTREEWLALGEQVFFHMPMRRDAYLEWAVRDREIAEGVGLEYDDAGNVRGVVEFTDGYGDTRQGATCGMCHANDGVPGQPNEELDLGMARALFGEEFGIDNSRYAEWGPGTVDVTDDQVGDALAIPSLWSLEHQSHINTSGAIKLATPAALAIRFETQYIVGHSMLERPHRVFVWALTMYVLSLEADTEPDHSDPGFDVFERACAGCHSPEHDYGGPLIDAATINYDQRAANSIYRGTGYYRTPTLVGVSKSDRFMHDAKVTSLDELLASGHPNGGVLDVEEREDLLSFLNSL